LAFAEKTSVTAPGQESFANFRKAGVI